MSLWSEIQAWGECEEDAAICSGRDANAAYRAFMLGARCFAREVLMQYERHEWDEARLIAELQAVASLEDGDACAR